jgi:hypothetical protein
MTLVRKPRSSPKEQVRPDHSSGRMGQRPSSTLGAELNDLTTIDPSASRSQAVNSRPASASRPTAIPSLSPRITPARLQLAPAIELRQETSPESWLLRGRCASVPPRAVLNGS